MSGSGDRAQLDAGRSSPGSLFRWECRCQQSPVLLATYDDHGCVHIKARDRYWHIHGTVQTICPRCGAEHALDLRVGGRKSEVGRETARRQDGETVKGSESCIP